MRSDYPCRCCGKRPRCTGYKYKTCEPYLDWFHLVWTDLQGAPEREKYRTYLLVLMRRASWREE